jgi:heavy metal translocating P-type ATPase
VLGYPAGQAGLSRSAFLFTLIIGGIPVVSQTVRKMVRGKFASDVVASLAIVGALVTGEFLAGSVIVLMQTGGEALEDFAVRQASKSLKGLMERSPKTAHRKLLDSLEDIPVSLVVTGDHLVVKPGEIIPVDAVVVSGVSALDESALTGEPVPVAAFEGREVMSGSVAIDGALEIVALRPSSQSEYEQIVKLVAEAQQNKAPIGRLADRYALFFTPLTLVMCAIAWVITRRPEAVVAVLVVATPCPLILATPVAIISGINRAARNGIIVKGGAAIERIGKATAVVFDKTGTLTSGVPTVDRVVPLDGCSPSSLLRLAAGVEQLSAHPMARAVVARAKDEMGELPLATDMVEVAGQGVSGNVEGRLVSVGSRAYALERNLLDADTFSRRRLEVDACDDVTAVVGIDGRAAGLILYKDPLRPQVPALMERLKSLGVEETAMLTGDDELTASAIASEAGIATAKAGLRPGQKVEEVQGIMKRHSNVVMVGDGINDAPALAAATVGIALGAHGAAVSSEAADIVILPDDVGRVAEAVAVGKRTLRVARQSILIGLGASGGLMVVAAFGYIQPAFGALLQEFLDIGVILNALRAR